MTVSIEPDWTLPVQTGLAPPPLGTGDTIGTVYVDTSQTPNHLYTSDGADFLNYLPAGGTDPDQSNPRLEQAAMLYSIRYLKLNQSALGLSGGFDIGAVYVGSISGDYHNLIRNYRGSTVPMFQQWPTLEDVKRELGITGSESDDQITLAIDAAIDQIRIDITGAPGLA